MKAFGIAGWSGAGKTTLLEQLIPRFVARGLRVSLIKHTHHDFDIDRPGKDSYRLREAGCSEVMLLSGRRWALMHELRGDPEPDLADQLALLGPCDLVLVEGYKVADLPKLEVHRPGLGKPLLLERDDEIAQRIVAVASSELLTVRVPCLALHDYDGIVQFILDHLHIR
jgi:molybdopterin-guanine dinucleotide biosynthesis protein B